MKNGLGIWAAALVVSGSIACSGDPGVDEPSATDMAAEGDPGADDAASELGTAEQAWWSYSSSSFSFASSCSDPTGTDSLLAAIAVSTAKELRRWQPTLDFKVSSGMLVLTDTGKARCADGKCFNTQALLDLQRDSASRVQVRPGVTVSPYILRTRLTWNWNAQSRCTTSFFSSCRAPEHEFKFLGAERGACDMNHWFEVRSPLGALLSSAGLSSLQEKLVWVDEEDNSYIKFQVEGSAIAIDPTYGLNETGTTVAGSCTAACTKISSLNVAGQCCSCNGSRKYARSTWNANTYLCQ
jgi:hypothetical protein